VLTDLYYSNPLAGREEDAARRATDLGTAPATLGDVRLESVLRGRAGPSAIWRQYRPPDYGSNVSTGGGGTDTVTHTIPFVNHSIFDGTDGGCTPSRTRLQRDQRGRQRGGVGVLRVRPVGIPAGRTSRERVQHVGKIAGRRDRVLVPAPRTRYSTARARTACVHPRVGSGRMEMGAAGLKVLRWSNLV